ATTIRERVTVAAVSISDIEYPKCPRGRIDRDSPRCSNVNGAEVSFATSIRDDAACPFCRIAPIPARICIPSAIGIHHQLQMSARGVAANFHWRNKLSVVTAGGRSNWDECARKSRAGYDHEREGSNQNF